MSARSCLVPWDGTEHNTHQVNYLNDEEKEKLFGFKRFKNHPLVKKLAFLKYFVITTDMTQGKGVSYLIKRLIRRQYSSIHVNIMKLLRRIVEEISISDGHPDTDMIDLAFSKNDGPFKSAVSNADWRHIFPGNDLSNCLTKHAYRNPDIAMLLCFRAKLYSIQKKNLAAPSWFSLGLACCRGYHTRPHISIPICLKELADAKRSIEKWMDSVQYCEKALASFLNIWEIKEVFGEETFSGEGTSMSEAAFFGITQMARCNSSIAIVINQMHPNADQSILGYFKKSKSIYQKLFAVKVGRRKFQDYKEDEATIFLEYIYEKLMYAKALLKASQLADVKKILNGICNNLNFMSGIDKRELNFLEILTAPTGYKSHRYSTFWRNEDNRDCDIILEVSNFLWYYFHKIRNKKAVEGLDYYWHHGSQIMTVIRKLNESLRSRLQQNKIGKIFWI